MEGIGLSGKIKLKFGTLDATLDRVPYSLTLSDLSAEDHPLIYMNRSFREMTGAGDDRLGQNCRFLQADLENDQARAEIRLALAEGRRTQVILRNRRVDGEAFHNLLMLEPIRVQGPPGQIALGAQFELSAEDLSEIDTTPACARLSQPQGIGRHGAAATAGTPTDRGHVGGATGAILVHAERTFRRAGLTARPCDPPFAYPCKYRNSGPAGTVLCPHHFSRGDPNAKGPAGGRGLSGLLRCRLLRNVAVQPST